MKADDFRAFTEYYDQFYLQRKNYEKEVLWFFSELYKIFCNGANERWL